MKLMNVDASEASKSQKGFNYSYISFDKLGAPEYTIVQIVTDQSGSVGSFKTELENINKTCVESCKKSPRAESLLIRATVFDCNNVEELHGFTLLNAINPDDYTGAIDPGGTTPLFDATMDAVDSIADYAEKLYDKQFLVNAIIFVITDGCENSSKKVADPMEIKEAINNINSKEIVESITTVLIGVNTMDTQVADFLKRFNREAGFSQYVSIDEATPGKLAKLAKFVSQSVSSTSQALGTGGASQLVDPTALSI